jgi:hypothetical protein
MLIMEVIGFQRDRGVVHKIAGSQQPQFFSGESDEQQRAFEGVRMHGCQPGQFQHAGGSRGVVVGSMMDLANWIWRQRMFVAKSQMIVVCSDDHPFTSKTRIRARD